MFKTDTGHVEQDLNINNSESKSKTCKIHRLSKSKNSSEKLIELFGSTLDDVDIKEKEKVSKSPKKLNKMSRRHTLPVSISIDKDILKVTQKRKSIDDTNLPSTSSNSKVQRLTQKRKSIDDTNLPSTSSSSKVQRLEPINGTVCQLPEVELTCAQHLKLEMNTEVASSSVAVAQEMPVTVVLTRPDIREPNQANMMKIKSGIIDLTKSDSEELHVHSSAMTRNNSMVLQNGIKIEIMEPSSKKANAPAPSMPLLPPISPAEAIQPENGLLETSGTTSAVTSQTVKTLKVGESSSKHLHMSTISSSQRPPPNVTIQKNQTEPASNGICPPPNINIQASQAQSLRNTHRSLYALIQRTQDVLNVTSSSSPNGTTQAVTQSIVSSTFSSSNTAIQTSQSQSILGAICTPNINVQTNQVQCLLNSTRPSPNTVIQTSQTYQSFTKGTPPNAVVRRSEAEHISSITRPSPSTNMQTSQTQCVVNAVHPPATTSAQTSRPVRPPPNINIQTSQVQSVLRSTCSLLNNNIETSQAQPISNGTSNQAQVEKSSGGPSVLQEIYSAQHKQQTATAQPSNQQNLNQRNQIGISPSGGLLHFQNQQIPTTQTQSVITSQQPLQPTINHQSRPLPDTRQKQAPMSCTGQQTTISHPSQQTYPQVQNVPLSASTYIQSLQKIASQRQLLASNRMEIPPHQPEMLHNSYCQPQTNQNRNQPPPSYQHFPQLIRLFRPTNLANEYVLVTHAACAEILFSHFCTFSKWRESAYEFTNQMQNILGQQQLKEHCDAFLVYCTRMMKFFGKRMIQDLLTIDVDNFSFTEILHLTSRKLQEKNYSASTVRICVNFHLMFRHCEALCTTPFTQKFFKQVKITSDKLYEKGSTSSLFNVSQLKRLEMQIRQYLMINNWINAYQARAVNNNRRVDLQAAHIYHRPTPPYVPHHPRPSRPQTNQTVQKPKEHVATFRPSDQISLTNLSQGHSIPDRSGTSDSRNLSAQVMPTRNDSGPEENSILPQRTVPEDHRQSSLQEGAYVQSTDTSCTSTSSVNHTISTSESSTTSALESSTLTKESSSSVPSVDVINYDRPLSAVPTPSSTTSSGIDVKDFKTDSENEERNDNPEEIIDLTWIDDGDEIEVIKECKAFPFKMKEPAESESEGSMRETVSPADSGLGSPHPQGDCVDTFKCLCGNRAIYVCACNSSMYCSRECQINDWADHQRWCQEAKP